MSVVITGGAGFVGANLAASLLARGQRVIVLDNFCRGTVRNLEPLLGNPKFRVEEQELNLLDSYLSVMRTMHEEDPITEVWHLAANSDIPAGIADSAIDLNDTFMTTYNTLQVMRELSIGTLAFASSSAVYGDLGSTPLTETTGPLLPISNYGAMKLASEGAISAALESYLDQVFMFRFPNVVGVPATHGVILDFVHKLQEHPDYLDVLGDGTQQKGYLHVEELIDAMLFVRDNADARINCYNVGASDEGATVRFIAEQVVALVSPGAEIRFGQGGRGWVGDVPRFTYCTDKLASLGWQPKWSSQQSVTKAIAQIWQQEQGAPL
jgi:UDP-glucose 4-epimerase